MTECIEWAERFIATHLTVDAAIVRGNELWVRSEMAGQPGVTELYLFVRIGEKPPPPEFIHEVFRTEEGVLYMVHAWLGLSIPVREVDQETQEALLDAQQKLDISETDSYQRRERVIELMRWSARAGQTTFSADDD